MTGTGGFCISIMHIKLFTKRGCSKCQNLPESTICLNTTKKMSIAISVYTMSAKAKLIRMVAKKCFAALMTSETKPSQKEESNDHRDGSEYDFHNLNNDDVV